jgi:hypothetical protein
VGCKSKGIQVIDVRHEVNAVFAADAVSRISGIPGVAIVSLLFHILLWKATWRDIVDPK